MEQQQILAKKKKMKATEEKREYEKNGPPFDVFF